MCGKVCLQSLLQDLGSIIDGDGESIGKSVGVRHDVNLEKTCAFLRHGEETAMLQRAVRLAGGGAAHKRLQRLAAGIRDGAHWQLLAKGEIQDAVIVRNVSLVDFGIADKVWHNERCQRHEL